MSIPALISPSENAIRAQFASRPTLEGVAQQLLTTAINEKYPALNIDLARTWLATPDAYGYGSLVPLMSRVMDYLATGTALDLGPFYAWPHYLADEQGQRLGLHSARPDMKVIEALIKELAWSLPISLQNALSDYWEELADTGVSRWRWFSEVLQDTLSMAVARQNNLSDLARDTLNQVIQCPEFEHRSRRYGENVTHAYCLEATLTSNSAISSRLSSAFMLVRSGQILMCQADGNIRSFPTRDAAITDEGQRISQIWAVDKIGIKCYESDGNIFEIQAATVLNQQLADLGALKLPASIGLEALQTVYLARTDPVHSLLDPPRGSPQMLEALKAHLPDWLQHAPAADQALYRRYTVDLARAKKNSAGQTFLTGIADIRTFAAGALIEQMRREQSRVEPPTRGHISSDFYNPNDIELTFLTVAGFPGTVGIIEPVTMSLTDLALRNLVGRPQGVLLLRHRFGWVLPVWLTPDYIVRKGGLIEQVNIGKTYPEKLSAELLSHTADALRREQIFAEQLRVQLPLQALESSLKQENGLTALGARYVAALMQDETEQQHVEGVAVVIRHLALVRKPGAHPDVVSNMFIIEPADTAFGPHLLYRPLYSPALHEFSSRAALLQAIATPGVLQTSVLIWLSDSARQIYADGGFQQPHYVRFGLGSDFAPIETPLPASLSTNGSNDELLQYLHQGKLLQFLYGSNARALLDQADRSAVSNSESRWGVLLEGGGLLFNTLLLPLLRGPAMLTGGLLSLIAAADKDIPALNSADPVTRELAAVDMLLGLGMLLFQASPSFTPERPRLAHGVWEQSVRSRIPVRVAQQWPEPPPPTVTDGKVLLAGELPKSASTTLDFSFASASNRLSPSQRLQLSRLQVAYTAPLPPPTLKGVYVINREWHALVDGNLYRVEGAASNELVIVDPQDSNHLGPRLEWSQDRWTMDLHLRLRGGMPPKRIAEMRQKKNQRTVQLKADLDRLLAEQEARLKEITITQSVMERGQQDPRFSASERALQRQRFDSVLKAQLETYQHMLESNQERTELQIAIPPDTMAFLMENVIIAGRKSALVAEMDRDALYEKWAQFIVRGPALRQAVAADRPGFNQFVKALVEINERAIHWLELKERYLEELYNLGEAGAERFSRLSRFRSFEERCALCLKAMQLHTLRHPSVKIWDSTLLDNLEAVLNPLQEQVRTHVDLATFDFSPGERLQVLDSLVKHYGKALDALCGISIVNADELDGDYFPKMLALVDDLYQTATQQLAGEIRPPAKPRKHPPKSTPAQAGKPLKRVIKTRNRGSLIGELKPPEGDRLVEVIEMRSEENNQLLATYSQQGDEWDEITPKPARPPAATRPLSQVKGEARKLFSQLEEHLKRAESYKKISKYPQELEEVLKHEADRLDNMATELEQSIRALPEALRLEADQSLVTDMRSGAARLMHKARELRAQLSLELPPTHGNLQYLLEQDLVEIGRPGARVKLSGERKDFIQEYAISKAGGTPLWCAHFHYGAADTPKSNYNVAHLKRWDQRKLSYYSLLAEAQSPQATINVHHGLIGKDLAERWFLPLAL